MGDRDGQRIRDVVGFGRGLQIEQLCDHELNLLFIRVTIPDDGLLDFGESIRTTAGRGD